jgi:uncharacterized membrane protein
MHEPRLDFGPLQMLTVVFDGNRFKGEILPELQRLKKRRVVRIVDLLAIRKDDTGALAVLTASDLGWEEATQFGAYIGTLVGFGAAGPDGADRGAIAGAAELADGHLFNDEDRERLISIVPENSTIAMVLFEHLWALPFLEAIERADGLELRNEWIGVDQLVATGMRAVSDNPNPRRG